MKSRKLLVIGLLVFIGLLVNSPIWGQSPSPEASPAAEEEELDESKEYIREEVKKRVQAARAGQKRAFVGEIADITNTTLVLDTGRGEKQVRAGEETTIIGLERKEIEFEDLEIGSFTIAMGYLEETGILDARRIVIDKKPKIPDRLVAFGEVTDESSEEKILTVKHPQKGTVYMVEVTGTTEITSKVGDEIETIKYEEINVDDLLVAVGTPTEGKENFITAKLIHIFLSRAAGQGEATPSAETED